MCMLSECIIIIVEKIEAHYTNPNEPISVYDKICQEFCTLLKSEIHPS